jgi:hypothetical protein
MNIAKNSNIRIQAFGHYVGVGANWDASILLKGVYPTPEDDFLLELCSDADELRYGEEFVLRAYNRRYVAVSKGVFCAFGREKTAAARFRIEPLSNGDSMPYLGCMVLLYFGQEHVVISSLQGAKLMMKGLGQDATQITFNLCDTGPIQENQEMEKQAHTRSSNDDAIRGTGHEWLDEKDLLSLDELERYDDQFDITKEMEKESAQLKRKVTSSLSLGTSVIPERKVQADMAESRPGLITKSDDLIASTEPLFSSPVLESVRDRLEAQLQQLLEVRRMECRIADECQLLIDRCEQLQECIPRLPLLAERRLLLQQSLEQFMEVLPEDACQVIGIESQVLTRLTQLLPVCLGYKDSLSAALQMSLGQCQTLFADIEQLRSDLNAKKQEMDDFLAVAEELRGQLSPHLEANLRIANLVPGARGMMDVLNEVRRLLEESDCLLAAFVQTAVDNSQGT